jgi:hypothetical protein
VITYAHLGHWYSAFGFLVPAVLVILWIRFQARRGQRRQEFSQYWTLELRDRQWKIVEIAPAPASRRQHRARLTLVPPPWSAPVPGSGEQTADEAASTDAASTQEGSPSASNGHAG